MCALRVCEINLSEFAVLHTITWAGAEVFPGEQSQQAMSHLEQNSELPQPRESCFPHRAACCASSPMLFRWMAPGQKFLVLRQP
jgi:hypothetical protein